MDEDRRMTSATCVRHPGSVWVCPGPCVGCGGSWGGLETRRRFQTGLHSYSDEELAAGPGVSWAMRPPPGHGRTAHKRPERGAPRLIVVSIVLVRPRRRGCGEQGERVRCNRSAEGEQTLSCATAAFSHKIIQAGGRGSRREQKLHASKNPNH